MPTDRTEELEAVHDGVRQVLSMMEPHHLVVRHAPNSPSVGELIGLMLLDLDWLSSRPNIGKYRLPPFAAEFVDKRLARRLTNRYALRDLEAEFDRRFAAAQNAVSNAADADGFRPIVKRLSVRLEELKSAAR